MENLKKKVAVITGASRGLGYQAAKLLARKKIHVVGIARTVGGLETLSDEISEENGSSTIVPMDLKDDKAIDSLAVQIFERWTKIDIFIHCAVVASPMSPVTYLSLKDFDLSMMVNTRATIKLIQAFDPLFKTSNIKTALFVDDNHTGKFLSSYSSAKAATREVVNSYREETRRIGANVISFTPSAMPTALRARFYPGESQDNLLSCVSQATKLIAKLKL